jgi:hypothetical protein
MKTGQSRGIGPAGVQCKEGCMSWDGTNLLAGPGLVRVLGIQVVAPGPDGGRVTAAAPAHSRAVGR